MALSTEQPWQAVTSTALPDAAYTANHGADAQVLSHQAELLRSGWQAVPSEPQPEWSSVAPHIRHYDNHASAQ